MYQNKLSGIISKDLMKQSIEFIKEHKEARHKTVMERQIEKYNKLWAQKYESGRYTCTVPIAAMAQVATQTRTKLIPNVGL